MVSFETLFADYKPLPMPPFSVSFCLFFLLTFLLPQSPSSEELQPLGPRLSKCVLLAPGPFQTRVTTLLSRSPGRHSD